MLRRSRHCFGALGIASVAALALAACGSSGGSSASASASGMSTISLAFTTAPTNTTIEVAEEQGYFTKNHLNVELIKSTDAGALIPSLGKQIDLVGTNPPVILDAAQEGLKPELISSETLEDDGARKTTYLLTDKNITSVSELKGKTIGVPNPAGNLAESLVYELQQVGISASEVHFLTVPSADVDSDLQSGTIQAGVEITPFETQIIAQGYNNLGDPIEQDLHDAVTMSYGWISSQSWANSHSKQIQEFDAAQAEALAWMKAHKAGTAEVLENAFQIPAKVATTFPSTVDVAFGTSDSYLADWVPLLKSIGNLKQSYNPDISQLVH